MIEKIINKTGVQTEYLKAWNAVWLLPWKPVQACVVAWLL